MFLYGQKHCFPCLIRIHICIVMCFRERRSVFRPIGVIGGGEIPMAFVGSIVFLLVLLRYVCIRLSPSAQNNIREVPMGKTLTVKARELSSTVLETIWTIGAGGVAGHLST